MAKKPKANSHDKTIRNVIIGFGVLVLILAAILVWNNRSLSYAGTVDGERMSLPQLSFHQNEAWGMLLEEQWGMTPDQGTFDLAMLIGFESLVDFYVTIGRAADFGLSLADVDAEQVDSRIEFYQMIYNDHEFDIVTSLGFTDATFRRFVELRELQDLVYRHVTELLVITEDALEVAYERHMEEIFFFLKDVLVHIIDVASLEDAENVLAQIEDGADFVDLMRTHSISYSPHNQQEGPDGQIIETINARSTSLAEDDDLLRIAYGMEEGEVSDIIELPNGNFAIFEIVTINEMIDDYEAFEAAVRANQERDLRDGYFRERLQTWRSEADIVRNARVVGEGFE